MSIKPANIKSLTAYAKNTGWYLAASILSSAFLIAINPFLAKNLSADDYAIIGYFSSFNALILPIISMSLLQFYSRNFFFHTAEEQERLKNTVVIALIIFPIIVSIFVLAGLKLFFVVTDTRIPFYPYALLLIATIYFQNFFNLKLLDFKIRRKARKYFIVSVVRGAMLAMVCFSFVVIFEWGPIGYMTATALTAAFLGCYDAFRMVTKWELDRNLLIKVFHFAWPISLAAMLNYFFSGVDKAFLGQMNLSSELGIYNIGGQIANYLILFYTAVGSVFQPDILEAISQNNFRRVVKISVGMVAINAFVVAIFIIFAPYIVNVLTAGRYMDAVPFARIISLSTIPMVVYFSLSTIIIGCGFYKTTLWNKIIGSILVVLMFKFMIVQWQFYGAAWGQTISYTILSLISVVFLYYMISHRKKISQS